MGLFDDLIPSAGNADGGNPNVPRITVTPRDVPAVGRQLLDTIAGSESPGYNTIYGGQQFQDFADHPRQAVPITSGPNAGKTSSAAGRYQFLGSTWDQVKKEAGLPDFSPDSQDKGAWYLANKTYQQKTGRDLAADLENAKGNPNAIAGIGKMLSGVWTSLPGGIEPNRATGSFAQRYDGASAPTEFSAQARRPSGLFDDLVPQQQAQQQPPGGLPADNGGQFSAPPAGGNFRTAREGQSEVPPGFVDKLSKMWDNPPRDRLSLIAMAKDIYTSAKTLGEAGAGDIPITGPDGRTNPDVIGAATIGAMAIPMRGAPGGLLARPVTADAALVANVAKGSVAAPSTAELKAAARAGFESPAVKDLEIAPRAINEFGQGIRSKLNEAGIDENLAPKTFGVLSKLENVPEDAFVTGQNLQSMRRTFQNAAGAPDKTERLAASKVIEAIDEFIPNVAAREILSGDLGTVDRPHCSHGTRTRRCVPPRCPSGR